LGRKLESWRVDQLLLAGGPGDPVCWQHPTE
jgi:hypothetical protein